MRIICVEGCHGCGKTKIIKLLADIGYNTLDEGFLDMPKFSLNPQSFVMELLWVSKWIERALELHNADPDSVFFSDRSPFSAVFYAENGTLLEPIIAEAIENLGTVGVEIINIYISVEKPILWSRISERLAREPERMNYREDKYDWMTTTVNFYDSATRLWDYTIKNNDSSLVEPVSELMNISYFH